MKAMRVIRDTMLLVVFGVILAGCAHMPGGIAASTTPIEGRKYTIVGRVVETDSMIYLLGLIPVTGVNTTHEAIDAAVRSRRGDAMINVCVESYSQWWILFSRYVTMVEGDVIRFEP